MLWRLESIIVLCWRLGSTGIPSEFAVPLGELPMNEQNRPLAAHAALVKAVGAQGHQVADAEDLVQEGFLEGLKRQNVRNLEGYAYWLASKRGISSRTRERR